MLQVFVNSEGGLTPAGYALSVAVLAVCVAAGLALADRGGQKGGSTRRLAYCAMAMALAYVTSYIRVFKLPYGGSVTLLSMLFIVLVANWYGVRTGALVGFAYGMRKNGLLYGYLLAVLARGAFHSLGGYLYWLDYMPDNFPTSLTKVYPIVYNYSYLLAEAAITVILLKIPAVKQALGRIQKDAVKQEEIRQNSQFLP